MTWNYSMFVFSFQDGWSALMMASCNGHTEIVKYLIEAKASLDLQKQVYSALNRDDDDIFYIKFWRLLIVVYTLQSTFFCWDIGSDIKLFHVRFLISGWAECFNVSITLWPYRDCQISHWSKGVTGFTRTGISIVHNILMMMIYFTSSFEDC